MNFKEELEKKTGKVEDILAAYLPKPEGFQSKVLEAMVYAVSAGGKRLRPLMMAESAALFVEAEEVWRDCSAQACHGEGAACVYGSH